MQTKIKVLKKGDVVLNAFPFEGSLALAIQRKGGDVDILLVKKNSDGVLELGDKLSVCEGDHSIEVTAGDTKVTTF